MIRTVRGASGKTDDEDEEDQETVVQDTVAYMAFQLQQALLLILTSLILTLILQIRPQPRA